MSKMTLRAFIFKKNKDITLGVKGKYLTDNTNYCLIYIYVYICENIVFIFLYSAIYIYRPILTIGKYKFEPCVDMLEDEIKIIEKLKRHSSIIIV